MMIKTIVGGLCIAAVFGLLTGCGGSSTAAGNTAGSGNGSGSNNTPPIQGIATPSSVSVVTATNSN